MIFVCYSHDDGCEALAEVQRQFGVLGESSIKFWSDKEISPGNDWRHDIWTALSSSRLAVLIITPGFLQSPFVLNVEVPNILRRYQAGGMLVLPIYWTACHYKISPWLSEMQLVTANNDSIGSLPYEERAKLLAKVVGECAQELAQTVSVEVAGNMVSLRRSPLIETISTAAGYWFSSHLDYLPRQRRFDAVAPTKLFTPIVSTGKHNILNLRGLGLVRFPTNIPNFQDFETIDLRDNEIETLPDLNKMLSMQFANLALRYKEYRIQWANAHRRARGKKRKSEVYPRSNQAMPTEPEGGLYLAGNPFIDPLLKAAADQLQPAATLDVLAYCRGDKKKLAQKFKIDAPPTTVRSVRSAALADAEEQGGELGLGPNKLHDMPDPRLLQKLADARQQLIVVVDKMVIRSIPGNSPPILRNTLRLYLEEIGDQRPIPAMLDMYASVILASVDDRETRELLGALLVKAFLEFEKSHQAYMGIYSKYQERDRILEACEIDFERTPVLEFSAKFNEAASLFRSDAGTAVLTKAPQEFAEAVSALLTTSEHSASALRERELRRWAVGGYATLSLLQGFLGDPSRTAALTANKQDVDTLRGSLAKITQWFFDKIGLSEEGAA
jgi:hypothetical protein